MATFGGFIEIPTYLPISGGTLTGNLTIDDLSPGLFFEGGSAVIGTLDNNSLQIETDSTILGGFDVPGTFTNQAMYLGGTISTIKSNFASSLGVNTLGLGIYTVDSNALQNNGSFIYGDTGFQSLYIVNSTAQNGAQYRYAMVSQISLSPSLTYTYSGVYTGMFMSAVNTGATCNGTLIGGTFFTQAYSSTSSRLIVGGEFGARSYGIGEIPTAIAGAFDNAQSTGTGTNPHVAVGALIGLSTVVYSAGISASGSSVSNTAIGLWIPSGSLTATGTGAAQYALKIDDTSQNTFAGSISTATRLLSGGASTATNTTLITKDGNWKTTQTTAPTTTTNANAGTGASSSVAHATDVSGQLTLNSTATLSASGAQVSVNFNKTYNVAPIVLLTPANAKAATLAVSSGVYVTSGTSSFTINFANADVVGDTYIWNYFCLETS